MDERQAAERFLSEGTDDAFCELFEAVYPGLRRYFVLRGLDVAAAEEAAQNVMLIVYRKAATVRQSELFFGWLYRIARHELFHYRRQNKPAVETVELEAFRQELEQRWQTASGTEPTPIWDLLERLEQGQRDVLVLRYIEELSYEELAVVFAIPVGTAKWRVYSARQKLVALIEEEQRQGRLGLRRRSPRIEIND